MNVLMASGEGGRLTASGERTRLAVEDPGRPTNCNPFNTSKIFLGLFLLGTLVVLGIGGIIGVTSYNRYFPVDGGKRSIDSETDSETSAFQRYRFAAVAADAPECSTVGTEVFADGGGAVDAAIASVLCAGLLNPHSTGIGGGSFMLIYDKAPGESERRVVALDSRETAPMATAAHFKSRNASEWKSTGPLSIGVPGEIRGYYEAWQRYGRLPWERLFQPVIRMCRDGYELRQPAADALDRKWEELQQDASWRELYQRPDGERYQVHEIMTNPRLADTLEQIVADPEGFYTSQLADKIMADLQEADSVMSSGELGAYQALWRKPVAVDLASVGLTSYSMPPPSSGAVYNFMLRLLEGFNPQPSDIRFEETAILAYQRIAETFKFGFAERTYLADPDYVNITQYLARLQSDEYINQVQSRIDDSRTHQPPYYHPASDVTKDSGTSHISILAPDGSAVSMTSTINSNFGSLVRGSRTGIIFNNELDDFSFPSSGSAPNPSNGMAGGKRPLSSMVPSMMLDANGRVRLVIGGSGGQRILTAATYVTTHHLFYGKRLDRAVDTHRLHHALSPNKLQYEDGFPKDVLSGLTKKGHVMETMSSTASVIQAIQSDCGPCVHALCRTTCIQAVSDRRKGGVPDGF